MDLAIVYSRLVPGYRGHGCFYDDSFKWLDERPKPTREECRTEWELYCKEVERKEIYKNAHIKYETALNSGYLHTDGITYHCSEAATLDYVKLVTLLDIALDEPVRLLTFDGTPREMTYADFRIMAVAVGQYQYALRLTLWDTIK